MHRQLVGIFVMLNNYFHDLAVGVLFSSILTARFLRRGLDAAPAERRRFMAEIAGQLGAVANASLLWIVIGGVVRAIAYRDFEWQPAAGRGQVPALFAKHVVLVSTTVAGVLLLHDLRRGLESDRQSGSEH